MYTEEAIHVGLNIFHTCTHFHQGPGASSDSLLGCEAHGIRSVWLWLWRCSGAPHELCLAKHLWDFSTHGTVIQWCCGGTASGRGPRKSAAVHNAGTVKGHTTAVIQVLFEGGAAHVLALDTSLLSLFSSGALPSSQKGAWSLLEDLQQSVHWITGRIMSSGTHLWLVCCIVCI